MAEDGENTGNASGVAHQVRPHHSGSRGRAGLVQRALHPEPGLRGAQSSGDLRYLSVGGTRRKGQVEITVSGRDVASREHGQAGHEQDNRCG